MRHECPSCHQDLESEDLLSRERRLKDMANQMVEEQEKELREAEAKLHAFRIGLTALQSHYNTCMGVVPSHYWQSLIAHPSKLIADLLEVATLNPQPSTPK